MHPVVGEAAVVLHRTLPDCRSKVHFYGDCAAENTQVGAFHTMFIFSVHTMFDIEREEREREREREIDCLC